MNLSFGAPLLFNRSSINDNSLVSLPDRSLHRKPSKTMIQTIQAKDITLEELETLFHLQLVQDNQFFREW